MTIKQEAPVDYYCKQTTPSYGARYPVDSLGAFRVSYVTCRICRFIRTVNQHFSDDNDQLSGACARV
jgi:hypothetical protein